MSEGMVALLAVLGWAAFVALILWADRLDEQAEDEWMENFLRRLNNPPP